MNKVPNLPSFKPIVKIQVMGDKDPYPNCFPFVVGDKIFVSATTGEQDYLRDPVKNKAWVNNKITSPKVWWLMYILKGSHPNLKKAEELYGGSLPEAVASLYHPVWQLRLALGLPTTEQLIDDAKLQWAFLWHKKDRVAANYLH